MGYEDYSDCPTTSLFAEDPAFKTQRDTALRDYAAIAAQASDDRTAVENKKTLLSEADKVLAPFKQLCDFHIRAYTDRSITEQDYLHKMAGHQTNLLAEERSEQCFHWELEFPEVLLHQRGFDCVIGNPPYSVPKASIYLAIAFEKVFNGRANLWQAFVYQGLILINGLGRVGVIIPRTMLNDSYSKSLRGYLRQSAHIDSIIDIRDRHNTFPGVLQACVITLFSHRANDLPALLGSVDRPTDLPGEFPIAKITYKSIFIGKPGEQKILHSPYPEIYGIFDKIYRNSHNLVGLGLPAKTGPVQWDKYTDKLQASETPNSTMLLWAENVQRYRLASARVRANKQYIRMPLGFEPNVSGKTILIQRITAQEQEWRIIACLVVLEKYSYSENHTNYISIPNNQDAVSLLLILNSSLIDFIFRHINSNTQVSSGELNSLPIKLPTLDQAANMLEIYQEFKGFGDSHKIMIAQELADELIFDVYALTAEERRFIRLSRSNR